jgi:hypothetical protein
VELTRSPGSTPTKAPVDVVSSRLVLNEASVCLETIAIKRPATVFLDMSSNARSVAQVR